MCHNNFPKRYKLWLAVVSYPVVRVRVRVSVMVRVRVRIRVRVRRTFTVGTLLITNAVLNCRLGLLNCSGLSPIKMHNVVS